jgi:ankyrin repeat protein
MVARGKATAPVATKMMRRKPYLPPVELPSSTLTADAVVDEVYINDAFPLHAAIRRGDYDALRALLHTGDLAKLFLQDEVSGMDPFQLAVHRDNAIMLQMLVRAVPARTVTQDDVRSASRRPPAPCLAAREGKMECLSVFLDASATNLLARDTAGNSVMHLVCRRKIRASALSLCFDCLRRDASTSFITKVICSRNEAGQTPVHIASSGGRTDLVELFLGFGSLSLLSKVLSIQDNKRQTPLLAAVASASTDTVMSLLMWSGNNNLVMQKAETTLPSPLLWAACAFQVDMVDLLLGFFHSTGNKQGLDATLRQVVELECLPTNRQAKSKIIARLTRAGANPCTLHNDKLSTMEIATNLRDRETLTVLIDSHKAYLQKLQTSRRRDPVLKKQPKSYFDGLEQVENGSLRAALRNSLLVCLINILKHGNKEPGSVMESCAILLYEKGATVNPDGFEMIKTAVCRTSFWLPCDGSQEEIAFAPFGHPPCPVPARNHVRHPYIQNGEEARLPLVVGGKTGSLVHAHGM